MKSNIKKNIYNNNNNNNNPKVKKYIEMRRYGLLKRRSICFSY